MGNDGWIKLHRSILYNGLWDKKPFSEGQAWIDLLLLANHEDKKTLYKGKIIEFKRGTVNRSILSLADRWGWDRKKARKFLDILESEQMVVIKRAANGTTNGTMITIVKYDDYQDLGTMNRTMNGTKDGTKTPQRLPTNKNEKNEKNINKKEVDKSTRTFKPPTLEEVKAYCDERKNGIDAQAFIDFYASKGWMVGKNKMKDWKASVRTWERRRTKDSKIEIDTKFRDFLEKNQVVDFGM